MSRFVFYYLCVFALQLAIGLILDSLGVSGHAELSIPIAGLLTTVAFMTPSRFRRGLEGLRASARAGNRVPLDYGAVCVVVVVGISVLTAVPPGSPATLTVFAALSEEVFLRAVPLLLLASTSSWNLPSVIQATLFSSVVFAIGHDLGNPWLTFDKLIFGIVAALSIVVTSRIWIAFALHAVTNLGAVWLFTSVPGLAEETFAAMSILTSVGAVITLAFAARNRTARDSLASDDSAFPVRGPVAARPTR